MPLNKDSTADSLYVRHVFNAFKSCWFLVEYCLRTYNPEQLQWHNTTKAPSYTLTIYHKGCTNKRRWSILKEKIQLSFLSRSLCWRLFAFLKNQLIYLKRQKMIQLPYSMICFRYRTSAVPVQVFPIFTTFLGLSKKKPSYRRNTYKSWKVWYHIWSGPPLFFPCQDFQPFQKCQLTLFQTPPPSPNTY